VTAPVTTPAPATTPRGPPKFEVTCYRCGKKGHKSPDCPSKPKSSKKVCIQGSDLTRIEKENAFGYLGEWGMGITLDCGAGISIVPRECVLDSQLSGKRQTVYSFIGGLIEGDVCKVNFKIGGEIFEREAVGVPGEKINWTPCFRIDVSPEEEETKRVQHLIRRDGDLYGRWTARLWILGEPGRG